MPISVYYVTKLSYLIMCYLALHNLEGTILPHEKICRLIKRTKRIKYKETWDKDYEKER